MQMFHLPVFKNAFVKKGFEDRGTCVFKNVFQLMPGKAHKIRRKRADVMNAQIKSFQDPADGESKKKC